MPKESTKKKASPRKRKQPFLVITEYKVPVSFNDNKQSAIMEGVITQLAVASSKSNAAKAVAEHFKEQQPDGVIISSKVLDTIIGD